MKLIAVITVDLERSPLGTRSRLLDDLLGRPVLRRTVERVRRATLLQGLHVLCPAIQSDRVAAILEGLGAQIQSHDGRPAPYAELVRSGRIWGLDGWRGGIGGLCAFDEDIDLVHVRELLARTEADAAVCIPGAAAVVDPDLIDALVRHYEEFIESAKLAFTQAPPGLAPVVLGREMLAEWAQTGQPPGMLLTYHPDRPIADLTGREPCHRPPAQVIEARGRLLCDTRRSFERVRDLLSAGGESWSAVKIGEWLSARQTSHVEAVPREIEIELTTEDSAPTNLLRPRGSEVPRRGPLKLDQLRQITEWIADYDDVRIILGGFGEPCLHPQFGTVLRMLRDSSAMAIAVRTGGLVADAAVEAALFETPVDVIEVMLDAACTDTYRRVHGVDRFDEVMGRTERWLARRLTGGRVLPLVIPSFVKARETLDDMEEFFDSWQRRLGMALITGYSHHARQREDRAVSPMGPPRVGPCRRVFSRALILADGRMTTCDQDFAGKQSDGNVREQRLSLLWESGSFGQIRGSSSPDAPLCPACDEWHRP